ncbi:MAG: hypothetical protein JWO87_1865 [Phycisphaerales bacterium]|jgi:hypothetical protein|nr:hypothetical protein [Phycisphaerales bacterium]MDB5300202.1 hypothetical protein [Phycisphaerales bacterium]
MYCLGCFYDLRGLPEDRCPECGRFFDPANHRTFSRAAKPDGLKQLAHKKIAGAVQLLAPDDTPRVIQMVRRMADATTENARLRDYIAGLIASLVERGAVSPEEAEQILLHVETPLAVVVEEEPVATEEPEPAPSDELLELGRIVAEQGRAEPSSADVDP